ncbi:MAG TPA: M48 family metalloprotease [Candidatus Angelobacter sp.]|nr:M48 family metalloprotease [Candidatus Angelobacter sp.]
MAAPSPLSSNDLCILCRRRCATMRLYHLFLLGSSFGSVALATLNPVSLISGVSSGPFTSKGNLVIGMILVGSLLLVVDLRRKLVRDCEQGVLGKDLAATEEPQLRTLQQELLKHFASVAVSFHLDLRSSSARVIRTRRGIHVVIGPMALGLLYSNPAEFAAIVWHEAGHCREWDDILGHWTLNLTRFFAYCVLVLGLLVLITSSTLVGLAVKNGRNMFSAQIGLPLLGLLSCQFVLFALFAGGQFWYRFHEYNADLFSVVAGNGLGLRSYLASQKKQRGWIRRLIAVHPSNTSRIRRIIRYESAGETGKLDELFAPFRLREYLTGGAMYLFPSILLYQAITWGVISLFRSILPFK